MTRSHALCTLALALGFLVFASSARAATPDQILTRLAANQTHSWIDNGKGRDANLATYKAGGKLYITCMPVSEIGRRLLAEQGYVSRVVQVITHQSWNNLSDGHAMLEVWYAGQWNLYDIDANAQAVDASGRGVSLITQMDAVREGRAHWREIATDPLYRTDEPNPTLRALAAEIFGDPEAFYRRVMGTAFFPKDSAGIGVEVWYIDNSQTERLRAAGLLSGRYLADPRTWYILTGYPPTAPVTATSQPVAQAVPLPTVAPASAPVVKPKAKKRRCVRKPRRAGRSRPVARSRRVSRKCYRGSRSKSAKGGRSVSR